MGEGHSSVVVQGRRCRPVGQQTVPPTGGFRPGGRTGLAAPVVRRRPEATPMATVGRPGHAGSRARRRWNTTTSAARIRAAGPRPPQASSASGVAARPTGAPGPQTGVAISGDPVGDRFQEALGAWVHAGTSAPCVVHACSTVAAVTSQTVWQRRARPRPPLCAPRCRCRGSSGVRPWKMNRSRWRPSPPAPRPAARSAWLRRFLSCLLVTARLGLLACMSAPALVSVTHAFRRWCAALWPRRWERWGAVALPSPTGRAGGGHRGRRRADARLARGSPGLGRGHEPRPPHPPPRVAGAAGHTRPSSILYRVDRETPG